jgi:hypothetical protein
VGLFFLDLLCYLNFPLYSSGRHDHPAYIQMLTADTKGRDELSELKFLLVILSVINVRRVYLRWSNH